eukprot:12417585-Karenia_brevis.AAC.1
MQLMYDSGIKWRQFEDWAVSTPSQHIIVGMIRWIRVNKSGQMLYVHSKNKLSPIQEQDNKEEREESTVASSSKGQSTGGDQSNDDTQPMDVEAGGDSRPPFSGPGHQ